MAETRLIALTQLKISGLASFMKGRGRFYQRDCNMGLSMRIKRKWALRRKEGRSKSLDVGFSEFSSLFFTVFFFFPTGWFPKGK